jgi:acetylornithine deacetylase/succinyl-diaminopimelate desuccinylase family protein
MSALSAAETADFLQELVRIRTVNPPGGEAPAAEVIADRLKRSSFSIEFHEAEEARPIVIARQQGSKPGPRLLLNGHMDTMPPGSGWIRDPFAGVTEHGTMYGCGVFDMKAGVAAMVLAACAFVDESQPFRGELIVTAVPDEIAGGKKGTGHMIKEGLVAADMAIVCEPTGEQVFVAHRGALWIEITVRGKSAHGGRPWLGVNAISKMSAIIHALESELPRVLSSRTHPLVPSPTINIGMISGGDRVNMVADRCVLQLDRRLIPGERAEDAAAEIDRIVQRIALEDSQEWRAETKIFGCIDAGEVNRDEQIVKECQRAYEEVTGRPCGISATAGFQDAHYFIHAGIPTAMFGPFVPGVDTEPFISLAGSPEEHVEVARVVEAARVYHRLCNNILRA